MKIRFKIVLILALGIAGVTCVAFLLSRYYFENAFGTIERELLTDRLKGAEALFQKDQAELLDSAFMHAGDAGFIEELTGLVGSQLLPSSSSNILQRNKIAAIAYADPVGNIQQTFFFSENGDPVDAPALFDEFLASDSHLRVHRHKESRKVGLVTLDDPVGVLLVASVPVLPPEEDGLVQGTLIVTQRITDTTMYEVVQKAGLRIHIEAKGKSASPDFGKARANMPQKGGFHVRQLSPAALGGYMTLNDVYGDPAVLVRLIQPRTAYSKAFSISLKVTAATLVAGAVLLAACLGIAEITIMTRLRSLQKQVSDIEVQDDIAAAHVSLSGHDELTSISHGMRYVLSALKVNRFRWMRSERRLQAFMDSFDAGVILVDMSTGYIKRINAKAAHLGHKRRRDLLGKPVLNYLKRATGETTLENLRNPGASNGASGEFVLKNGEELPVTLSSRPLQLGSEEYVALFVTTPIGSDIPAESRQ